MLLGGTRSASRPSPRAAVSLLPQPIAAVRVHRTETSAGGIGINYVRGGHGPTLLLVAGYPQTWYAWDDILPELARHYTVVELALRDALRADAALTRRYAALKQDLARRFRHDREAYTEHKAPFIHEVLAIARDRS
jgi:pimeloyl-ACP methyl ester carboxylesterase